MVRPNSASIRGLPDPHEKSDGGVLGRPIVVFVWGVPTALRRHRERAARSTAQLYPNARLAKRSTSLRGGGSAAATHRLCLEPLRGTARRGIGTDAGDALRIAGR